MLASINIKPVNLDPNWISDCLRQANKMLWTIQARPSIIGRSLHKMLPTPRLSVMVSRGRNHRLGKQEVTWSVIVSYYQGLDISKKLSNSSAERNMNTINTFQIEF